MVLKLSQLYMIYEDIKMKKVNLYFKLRALDDQLLNFYDYEDENGIGEDQIVDFMRLKHQVILEIFTILKELGLPFFKLQKYIEEYGIGQSLDVGGMMITQIQTDEEQIERNQNKQQL